jgi:hypothetical protein
MRKIIYSLFILVFIVAGNETYAALGATTTGIGATTTGTGTTTGAGTTNTTVSTTTTTTSSTPAVKGCLVGFNYNPETGVKCLDVPITNGCFSGFNYSSLNGQKCNPTSVCANGASNYPVCNYISSTRICLFGGTYPTCSTAPTFVCANGASNYPTCSTVPNTSNAYDTKSCPLNMINPYSLCRDGKIEADKKDGNGCTLSYKCTNPSSVISSNTSNAYDTKVCPVVATPDTATFCPKGTIESVKDTNNVCVTSFKCVPPPATGFIPFVTHIFGLLTSYFK